MKSFYFRLLTLVLLVVVFNSCNQQGNNTLNKKFIEASNLNDINSSTNLFYIKKAKIDVNAKNAFTTKTIKIKYNTTDESGNNIRMIYII